MPTPDNLIETQANAEDQKEITFRKELESVINRFSKENGCNTPDFILANYLINCLSSFDAAVNQRTQWYSDNSVISKFIGSK